MSSRPQANQTSGLSKSAAKKNRKKEAAAAAAPSNPTQPLPSLSSTTPSNSAQPPRAANPFPPLPHPLPTNFDPSVFFQGSLGTFPGAEFTYEATEFYDDQAPHTAAGGGAGNNASPFGLPFPFDYSSLGANPPTAIAGGFNITHEDLIQTANELYRRMADPNFGSDDAYWSSLPPHLRQFIREAVPVNTNVGANGTARSTQNGAQAVNEGQQGMWMMAQQIVNAASQGMGLGPGVGAGLLAGVNGRQFSQPGLGEELGFRRHPDAPKEEEFDDEDEFDLDEPAYDTPNGVAPKKKNKKKKKKGGANAAAAPMAADQPPAQLPPAARQPPRQPIPPNPPVQQHHQQPPALNPPPPPATPAPINPPPSSRAAGKQPMTNAPAANPPPARSARAAGKAPASSAPAHNHHNHSHPPPAKPAAGSVAKGKAPANQPPAKIWTQSSIQDRENIRNFWLSLSELERKDLLQIEKEAVLKKMKEQHRHACGCAVCGRKKVNIESELDHLYEQYYDELRHYASEQRAAATGRTNPPPGAGPFPGSVEVDSTGQVTKFDHRAPDPNLVHDDIIDDASEEYDDEEYDDEDDLEDDEIGSDEAEVGDDIDDGHHHPPPRQARPIAKAPARPADGHDFMGFGNTLTTIKGGILTVADDLLKNDGQKFLEMMEQLAVARATREEQNIRDLQDETEDDYDEKDEEPISEAERIEEGKRMFQIFAARMFEARVLQAYRERVAKQREEQLLLELDAEDEFKRQREEKKASQSQKKKDKKKQQKQKLEEERLAREAAAAAEAEAIKAKAEQAERDRQKRAEEDRIKREAAKRAQAEEQARIAAEKKKRQQEEKDREEEANKKRREREEKARKEREAREKEAKEKEKREREERLVREKAEKAEKERLATERAEKDRLAKEAKDKADKERLAKVEEERQEKTRRDEITRKEREAAEQAKVLAAQQAQRERVKAEKAAAEKAAADKAVADRLAAASRPAQPIPVRPGKASTTSRNGSIVSPPADLGASPVKAAAVPGAARAPVRPQQKTPQPFFQQPIAPAGYRAAIPAQQYPPGFRPSFSGPSSAAFSPPPAVGVNGSSALSPNPPPRGYAPEPSPPFDLGPRTAPIGMGFPQSKTGRMPSTDATFSPPPPPIGSLAPRNASGDIGDSFAHAPGPAPIAPPGPIGRPSAFLDAPSGPSALGRSLSPAQPEQVFGSAALGGDDEIVQPARRTISNGWDIPTSAAPGAGRWSTAPTSSIWGTPGAADPSWATPAPRQPSFGGIGSGFGTSAPGQAVGVGAGGFGSIFGAPGVGTSLPSQQASQQSQPQQHGLGHSLHPQQAHHQQHH